VPAINANGLNTKEQ